MIISENNIVVYHGTTSRISGIDVSMGKPYKDFGRGFYVTQSKQHAKNLAIRNKRIEKERYGVNSEAYVYTYEMNVDKLHNFKVKEFADANFEWVQFVLGNRKVRERTHDFDIVVGPTANDDTMVVLNAYLDGLYGEIGSVDALNILLKNIEAENLPGQIYFSNNESTRFLTQIGQVEKL